MGWERYFVHNFFTAQEFDELERRLASSHRVAWERHSSARARIEALERDLGRIALVTRSLADLCISKGLLTKNELVQLMLEADLADGVRDQRLSADVVLPDESKPAPPRPEPQARKEKAKRRRPYP
jgi:hypothetical protein